MGIDARTDVGAGHGVASGGLFDELGLCVTPLPLCVFVTLWQVLLQRAAEALLPTPALPKLAHAALMHTNRSM